MGDDEVEWIHASLHAIGTPDSSRCSVIALERNNSVVVKAVVHSTKNYAKQSACGTSVGSMNSTRAEA